ncbi:MAG: hypothetical protein QXK88_05550 [Desulfurococcaceae archaeon]
MNQDTISKISQFLSGFSELLFKVNGIGFWLFVGGFVLLMILIGALALKVILSLVKAIPNLTIGQFIKLILVLSVVLIISGLFMP